MVPPQGGAFRALLVLICAGSTVHGAVIPDPQNVMIKCENQIPIVQWDYSHQHPDTMFRVYIRGSAGERIYETTDHQVDLSPSVWESEDQYMAYHSVKVTAVRGGNESNPVETKSFSYNQLKTVEVTCELDFPHPVDLAVDESGAIVSFPNPFSFYPELKRANKSELASFKFQISANDYTYESDCEVNQRCKIFFSGNVESCIKLNGWLLEGNKVGRVVFREKDDVCPSSSIGNHWVVVISMLAVIAVIFIIISFIVCKVRAWTIKTPLPEPLVPQEPIHRCLQRYSALDSGAVMSHVQVVDTMASADAMEEEEVSPTAALCGGSSGSGPQNPPKDSFYTEGRLSNSSSQEVMRLMSDGQRTDEDSANASVETESMSLNSTEEEEGEAVSPYDCPHVLHVDMGDGDTVVAYTGS